MWKALQETKALRPPTRRLSMNNQSPAESTSKAMDDDMPEPLTTRKLGISRNPSIGSLAFYPRIPRRKSSLSASVSTESANPVTSTRTPSLSDSLYQIEVAKIRKPQTNSPQNMIGRGVLEDPFIDKIPKPLAGNLTTSPNHKWRWSSGSWISPESISSSDSSLSLGPAHPGTNFLCPVDLPVTFISVRSTAKRTQIGMDPVSLCTTVHISADVNPISVPGTSANVPLDITIVLDSLPQPSVNLLTQITLGSSVLASHLMYKQDRVALAYVDGNSRHGFRVLLPMGFHNVDVFRSALNTFARRQPMKNPKPRSDLANTIEQASGMFSLSPRSAYCHLFFVSAVPPSHLSLPRINPAIGFHTISPQSCFPLNTNNAAPHPGWHISYDVGDCAAGPNETHFIRKISRVLRQLRSGIRPGPVFNPRLSVAPMGCCQINSVSNDCHLISLRPGETWSVPVEVHVPAVSKQTSQLMDYKLSTYHPIVEDLMAQIDHLLQEFALEEVTQPIMAARVDYQHSLLPELSTIHVNSYLTIIRSVSDYLETFSDIEGTCNEPSLSLGSLSESF